MEIKRYEPISLARGLIYGGFAAACVAAGLVGLIKPGETHWKVLGAVLLVLGPVLSWRLIGARLAYAKEIAWYTKQGMAVLPGTARGWVDEHRELMEEHIERTVKWWGQREIRGEARIRDFINGGQIVVLVQDEPIVDHKHGIRARELTQGNHTRVLWQPKDSGADFLALLRHGIGHMCLTAMGVPTEAHHARMAADQFPDA